MEKAERTKWADLLGKFRDKKTHDAVRVLWCSVSDQRFEKDRSGIFEPWGSLQIGVSIELNFNSSILETMDLLKFLRDYRDVIIWVFVIGLQKRVTSSLEAVCFSNTGAILTT